MSRPENSRSGIIALVMLGGTLAVAGIAHADPTPDSRGRAIVAAQLAAVQHWTDATPMIATFAPAAVILFPNGERTVEQANGIAESIAFLNPHSVVKTATFDHFTSGGNASVSWFTAELHFTVVSTEPQYKAISEQHTIRTIELLDGAAGWKVAVAAFANVAKLSPDGASHIKDATPPGPLVDLLAAPEALAGALDAGAVVFGTDPGERGVGADAKALVGRWKKLKLSLDVAQKAREVHTATYGYGMTNVQMPAAKASDYPLGMTAFVLALPGPGDTWSVIAASYGANF